jgi:hypothetical protein
MKASCNFSSVMYCEYIFVKEFTPPGVKNYFSLYLFKYLLYQNIVQIKVLRFNIIYIYGRSQ